MNRATFLKALQKALRWTFNPDEYTDILADYEGFFEAGYSEGKDDAQICAELGEPTDIARSLAETMEKKRVSPLWAKILTRMLLTAVAGFAGYLAGNSLHERATVFPDSTLLYIALIAVIWLFLNGFTRKLPPVVYFPSRMWKIAFTVCHVLTAALVACDFRFFTSGISALIAGQPTSAATLFYGKYLLPVFLFVPLLIAVIAVFGFYRANPLWFTVITHTFGAAVYLWTQFNILANLDDPAKIPPAFITLIVYGVAVAVSLLFALFIRKLSRGRA